MGDLRAWYVDVGVRPFCTYRALPIILAEDEDEAYALSVECVSPGELSAAAGFRESEMNGFLARRVFPYPTALPIPAFDYLSPRRLIVVQDAGAWARHYGCSLMMRTRAVPLDDRAYNKREGNARFFSLELWEWAQRSSSLSALGEAYSSAQGEADRRRAVSMWLRSKGYLVRQIEALARVHAERYLPRGIAREARCSRSALRQSTEV